MGGVVEEQRERCEALRAVPTHQLEPHSRNRDQNTSITADEVRACTRDAGQTWFSRADLLTQNHFLIPQVRDNPSDSPHKVGLGWGHGY